MKRNIKNMAFALLTLFAVTSCDLLEIDNYDGPNATIEGKILDIETGELVEQDIIDGAQIEFIEHVSKQRDVCRFVYDESDAW